MNERQPERLRFEQVLEIAFKLNETAFSYWQFFVVGIIAIVGWRFSVEIDLNTLQRIILTFVFLAGTFLSAVALGRIYTTLDVTLEELKVLARDIDFHTERAREVIERTGVLQLRIVYLIHATALVLLTVLTWAPLH